MNVIYANQKLPSFQDEQIIFLVGPTPRDKHVPSWRPDAIEILRDLGYEGLVLVPEDSEGQFRREYTDQIAWEQEGLEACSEFGCIAAWVPRCLETMPAFTTNVEFGLFVESGRLLYGRPDSAPKTAYLDWIYQDRTGRQPLLFLRELMVEAVKMVGY